MVLEEVEEVELFGIRLSGDLTLTFNHSRFRARVNGSLKMPAPSREQGKPHLHGRRDAPDLEHEPLTRDRPEVFRAVA